VEEYQLEDYMIEDLFGGFDIETESDLFSALKVMASEYGGDIVELLRVNDYLMNDFDSSDIVLEIDVEPKK
jgi:hypothetical protein